MSLQAAEFFAELHIPFANSTVVGDTYFATPILGSPLRLRIDLSQTIHADTYGGLHVAVVHADRGQLDAVTLSFVDHGTFHRRDEATATRPNAKRYGTFDKYHRPGQPPWEGAITTGLRKAIEQYTTIWFPGAWTAALPNRTTGRTAHTQPIPPPHRSGTRVR
ncbi:hypothetical protein [Streptomyces buecherae]|uniref:hypothetical protein n=1 Tax=Streptomyces buecherae TaxID=2763006 RepID=UPI001C2790E1|nr:hypothetical protein [Streptomyces buecherae]